MKKIITALILFILTSPLAFAQNFLQNDILLFKNLKLEVTEYPDAYGRPKNLYYFYTSIYDKKGRLDPKLDLKKLNVSQINDIIGNVLLVDDVIKMDNNEFYLKLINSNNEILYFKTTEGTNVYNFPFKILNKENIPTEYYSNKFYKRQKDFDKLVIFSSDPRNQTAQLHKVIKENGDIIYLLDMLINRDYLPKSNSNELDIKLSNNEFLNFKDVLIDTDVLGGKYVFRAQIKISPDLFNIFKNSLITKYRISGIEQEYINQNTSEEIQGFFKVIESLK